MKKEFTVQFYDDTKPLGEQQTTLKWLSQSLNAVKSKLRKMGIKYTVTISYKDDTVQ